MVVAEMKPTLRVSVSNTDSSNDESENSDQDINSEVDADSDVEADVESDDSGDDKEAIITNEGWADSVAKILGSSKPKNKKTLVLSRAKKHADIIKKEKDEKPSFEVIGDVVEEKPEIKDIPTEPPAKKIKHEKPSIRIKPNILEKDRERLLSKIATKGVVQLFNAVRNQQKTIEKDMDRKDLSEGKKEKLLKKFDKRTFLDTLMGQSKSIVVDEHVKSVKGEVKAEDEKPKWNALRDDFMMGAKLKDWDKEIEEE